MKAYGEYLPDQVDRVVKLSEAQLELVNDVRDLYSARVALEKEYATKLQVLAKKAVDRKNKRIASVVVGDEPAKAWGDETLRTSTLDYAYADLVASLDHAAQCHLNLSETLNTQIVDAAKIIEKKFEDTKKKQTTFYQKILSERDRVYTDRAKSKQKYDEECHDLESYRLKHGKASDDKHASRAAKQLEQQTADVQNCKNAYLLSMSVANKIKTRFYSEDIPMLENQFQDVQKSLLSHLTTLLQTAQTIHSNHSSTLQTRSAVVQKSLSQIDTDRDQELFVDNNIRPFSAPGDWEFEPCVGYYDTSEMSVEPAPKVFLQNKLARCRNQYAELGPQTDMKSREVEQLSKIVSAYSSDQSLGNSDEVFTNYIDAQHQLALLLSSTAALTAEMDVILAALGGDEGGQQPHELKSAAFPTPTPCACCTATIWGLSKQGKTCKVCGISVHNKCELKLPAECAGKPVGRAKSTKKGHHLPNSSSSTSLASSVSSFAPVSPIVHEEIHEHDSYDAQPTARVIFGFTPTSPFELAVTEGSRVSILEEDDGSGWIKVQDEQGGKGLIPATYIELVDDDTSRPLSATPSSVGSGEFVKGIYAYQAQGPDELDLTPGAMIQLSSGPEGGKDYGDGWWEGYDMNGKKGIFPSNYVEPA